MDIERHLILIKGEEQTEKVERCEYENGWLKVKFYNNETIYTYKQGKAKWYRNPKIINHEIYKVSRDGEELQGITKILHFGSFLRIFFNIGYMKVFPEASITMEQTSGASGNAGGCFEYLKALADIIGTKIEEDTSFLSKQYSKLKDINESSVLVSYLEKRPLKSSSKQIHPIFPFGFNLSQKSAVEKALVEQLSVIQGPPGTGKTQTILNIIANAVITNKTVAVVSNNNSATANVLEKLEKYGVDFIGAYLGNRENKEKFFGEQKGEYPDMNSWYLSPADFQAIREKLTLDEQRLNHMLEYQNKQAGLKNKLSMLETEAEYFYEYYSESNAAPIKIRTFSNINADKILKFMIEYQHKAENSRITLGEKIRNIFVYRIYSFSIYKHTLDNVISFLQKTYYDKRLKELKSEIEALSNKLQNYDFNNAMEEYSDNSMKLLKSKLAEKYGAKRNRDVFTEDALWKNFEAFIREYPVILSTTHSLRSCISENYLFDYVIFDEASQVDLLTGALALSCAKNTVIVGDMKQLPNVVDSDTAKKAMEIFEAFNPDSAYNYAENSLLSSMLALYKDIPKTLLKEHYRCHPKIIAFCNQKYYNNELVILTNEDEKDRPLVLYKTAKGRHARGKLNQRQIDVVFEEVLPEQNISDAETSVGIIAPYRLQTIALKNAIGSRNIEADTVHKYQGREKDIIILTTVANEVEAEDFVDNANLINVAVSRAVNKLIVVVSEGSEEWKGTNLGDLVRYIQYNNFEIVESQIYSVFDLLYRSYSEKLLEFLKSSKNVSEYKSENLMNGVIEKVLSMPEFQHLHHVLHQPLKMLIKDPSKLDDQECRYAMNILTHTDFVIFNKIDKAPVLVVEVDGYAYHANNPKQLERDRMKDGILEKYDIPNLRIRTDESGEEKRLKEKLREVLKI